MRILGLFLLAAMLPAQAPPALAPPPSAPAGEIPAAKTIGTMKEIMVEIIFNTSNEIFYVGRNEKKSEKEWMDLQMNALVLGETANLLMSPSRARDNDRWMRDAKLLWDVADRAYRFSKTRDLPALKALNDDLYEACQSCHEHYRPGYRRRL